MSLRISSPDDARDHNPTGMREHSAKVGRYWGTGGIISMPVGDTGSWVEPRVGTFMSHRVVTHDWVVATDPLRWCRMTPPHALWGPDAPLYM